MAVLLLLISYHTILLVGADFVSVDGTKPSSIKVFQMSLDCTGGLNVNEATCCFAMRECK